MFAERCGNNCAIQVRTSVCVIEPVLFVLSCVCLFYDVVAALLGLIVFGVFKMCVFVD